MWLAAYTYTERAAACTCANALDRWHDRFFRGELRSSAWLTAIPVMIVLLLFFILVPLSIWLTYAVAGIATIVAAGVALYSVPMILLIMWIALGHILRGAVTILALPLRAVRAVLFFVFQPRAAIELRKAYKKQTSSTRENAERVRRVKETLATEAESALKTRWWKPYLSIFTSIRHYDRLAEYIRSLSDVGEAAEDHFKRTQRSNHDRKRS